MEYHTPAGETALKKVTFSLDDDTVRAIDRTARRPRMPKSRVVREAVRVYGEQAETTSAEERARLLAAFDALVADDPIRSRAEIEAELESIRIARQAGGRSDRREPM